jgi:hypothetical protein
MASLIILVFLVLSGPLALLLGQDSRLDEKEWRHHTD